VRPEAALAAEFGGVAGTNMVAFMRLVNERFDTDWKV
jgi:hypothetical protein